MTKVCRRALLIVGFGEITSAATLAKTATYGHARILNIFRCE